MIQYLRNWGLELLMAVAVAAILAAMPGTLNAECWIVEEVHYDAGDSYCQPYYSACENCNVSP